jgi:hypothetical protein
MMNNPKSTFKKSDLRRVISAAQNEGLEVDAIEVAPDGTIKLRLGTEQPHVRNDWDDLEKT